MQAKPSYIGSTRLVLYLKISCGRLDKRSLTVAVLKRLLDVGLQLFSHPDQIR